MKEGRIVVLGGRTGMLGQSLMDFLTAEGMKPIAQGREDVDVLSTPELRQWLSDQAPEIVYNAVAYTAVDKAEDEPAPAFELNRNLPGNLARLARELNFRLVHFSTDFVFDGKADRPYEPGDPVNPLSVYGKSKLAGEQAILEKGPEQSLIIRTAWLFGPGRKNFVKTMLDLSQKRDELSVVHDQKGSPTYTRDLARHAHDLVRTGAAGVFHVVNCGQASWNELATEAIRIAGFHTPVRPIRTEDWPTKAVRPRYSVLSTAKFREATGVTPRPWLQALREYVYTDYGMAVE